MLKVVLEVLKFCAIGIGALSGVLGTLTETKDKSSGKITPAGRKIVALILVSALVAVATQSVESYLKRMADMDDHARRVADEQNTLKILQETHANLTAAEAMRLDFDQRSNSLLNKQEQTGNRIAGRLDQAANLIHQRVVGHLSQVKAFELEFFMEGIGTKLPDRFMGRPSLEPEIKFQNVLGTAVLKAVFCSSPKRVLAAEFDLPLAQSPRLDLNVEVYDESEECDVKVSLVSRRAEGAFSDELDLKRSNIIGDFAMFQAEVGENLLDPHAPLRFDSFVPCRAPSLVVSASRPEDAVEIAEHFRRTLPRVIGFNIIPNLEKDFKVSCEFQLDTKPSFDERAIVFVFKTAKKHFKRD